LIDWPVSHRAITDPSRAKGMFRTTTITLRQSRRNSNTIRPVSAAPSSPSMPTPQMARVTYGDWSNSNFTSMSSGRTAFIFGRLARTSRTTLSVEASARLVTRMYTARRPFTRA
jgi:hypothetical protein